MEEKIAEFFLPDNNTCFFSDLRESALVSQAIVQLVNTSTGVGRGWFETRQSGTKEAERLHLRQKN